MRHIKSTLAGLCVIALAGCGGMSPQARTVAGATGGAATGYAIAELADADGDWKAISALAGAAAGTLIARNPRKNRCAYANGRGGYKVRRCG